MFLPAPGDQEQKDGDEDVVACDYRVLKKEERCEGQRELEVAWKRRGEDEQRCGCQGDGSAAPVHGRVADVCADQDPEKEVPEAGRALVADVCLEQSAEGKTSRQLPGLRFVGPGLVVGNRFP